MCGILLWTRKTPSLVSHSLKLVSLCLPLSGKSRWGWGGRKGQLTWTRLPQGFKNSPTLFNKALSQDLKPFRRSHPCVTLLQYVDDLLLATETREECEEATKNLLAELGELRYRASAKKAHMSEVQNI